MKSIDIYDINRRNKIINKNCKEFLKNNLNHLLKLLDNEKNLYIGNMIDNLGSIIECLKKDKDLI